MANERRAEEVPTAPPPPPPEPYPAPGYPKVLYHKNGSAPPRLPNNDAELAALDPKEWTQVPPVESKEKETWPKLYANINVLPVWVNTEAEAGALGAAWREFDLPKPTPKLGPK